MLEATADECAYMRLSMPTKSAKTSRLRRFVLILIVLFITAIFFQVLWIGDHGDLDAPSANRPLTAGHTRTSVGVCITGQLCRLELHNKFHYFLRHTRHLHDLYLVTVLQDDDSCQFTNLPHKADTRFYSISEVERWMENKQIRGKAVQSNITSLVINDRYVHSLNKRGTVNETQRAINHYNQWHNLESCWDEFAMQDRRDLYIKLRDDSIFVSKFSLEHFVNSYAHAKEFHAKKVFVPDCLGWGGTNDKSAIILSGAAPEFFLGPKSMYLHYNDLECGVDGNQCHYLFNTYNPESFLQQALDAQAVEVIRVAPQFYPILTGTAIHYGRVVCFPHDIRQLGLGNVCLPDNLRNRVIFNCLLDIEFFCILSILVLIVFTSVFWVTVKVAKRNLDAPKSDSSFGAIAHHSRANHHRRRY
jgi:hypothetical protein